MKAKGEQKTQDGRRKRTTFQCSGLYSPPSLLAPHSCVPVHENDDALMRSGLFVGGSCEQDGRAQSGELWSTSS
eukprot:1332766-Alexandrium_andersonii.AAC.1